MAVRLASSLGRRNRVPASFKFCLSVWLLYQAVSYPFARDLFRDDVPLVERMAGYYDRADHTPIVVDSVEKSVR